MSRNYYSEIHLHIVWHTKLSMPLLTPQVEPLVHRHIRKRIVQTPGVFVHEVGGTETHVHVALTIMPTILISDLIGKLKGGTSHDVNRDSGRKRKVLEWQAGYGVVSFGTKDLEWVLAYIRERKQHHANGAVLERLELIHSNEPDQKREAKADLAQAEKHREAP
jgi:putative transposase